MHGEQEGNTLAELWKADNNPPPVLADPGSDAAVPAPTEGGPEQPVTPRRAPPPLVPGPGRRDPRRPRQPASGGPGDPGYDDRPAVVRPGRLTSDADGVCPRRVVLSHVTRQKRPRTRR